MKGIIASVLMWLLICVFTGNSLAKDLLITNYGAEFRPGTTNSRLVNEAIANGLQIQNKQEDSLLTRVKSVPGLIAIWDFKEREANEWISVEGSGFALKEKGPSVKQSAEGPVSGHSIELNGSNYLSLPYEETGALNVSDNAVTVIAWVKWKGSGTGFVGGMWNEYQDGGKRQYGLFVSLPYYNGTDQVCGHVSKTGKPTPPFPYSIDYSASRAVVPKEKWACVAFTYDGKYIKSYLNGKFEVREPELIKHTKGFKGFPDGLTQRKNPYYFPDGIGNNGSDFTLGAVLVGGSMGNFFKGNIGGLAIFDRALTDDEMKRIGIVPAD